MLHERAGHGVEAEPVLHRACQAYDAHAQVVFPGIFVLFDIAHGLKGAENVVYIALIKSHALAQLRHAKWLLFLETVQYFKSFLQAFYLDFVVIHTFSPANLNEIRTQD